MTEVKTLLLRRTLMAPSGKLADTWMLSLSRDSNLAKLLYALTSMPVTGSLNNAYNNETILTTLHDQRHNLSDISPPTKNVHKAITNSQLWLDVISQQKHATIEFKFKPQSLNLNVQELKYSKWI